MWWDKKPVCMQKSTHSLMLTGSEASKRNKQTPNECWRKLSLVGSLFPIDFLANVCKQSESMQWPSGVCLVVCLCVTNFNIDNISDTFYSRFIRLDPKVARGKTFKITWPLVTWPSVKVTAFTGDLQKKSHFWPFLTIFQTLFTVELRNMAKR